MAADGAVVEWAAIRAQAGGASLLVVHAYRWPISVDPAGYVMWLDRAPVEAAQVVADHAARRARAVAPGVRVATRLRPGSAAAALVREARKAELVVLGPSRPSRFRPWVLSVNDELVRRAPGRVVIVSDHDEVLR